MQIQLVTKITWTQSNNKNDGGHATFCLKTTFLPCGHQQKRGSRLIRRSWQSVHLVWTHLPCLIKHHIKRLEIYIGWFTWNCFSIKFESSTFFCWTIRKKDSMKAKIWNFFRLFVFISNAHNMRWKNLKLVLDENASFSFYGTSKFSRFGYLNFWIQ